MSALLPGPPVINYHKLPRLMKKDIYCIVVLEARQLEAEVSLWALGRGLSQRSCGPLSPGFAAHSRLPRGASASRAPLLSERQLSALGSTLIWSDLSPSDLVFK